MASATRNLVAAALVHGVLLYGSAIQASPNATYPWLATEPNSTVESRVPVPTGFHRVPVPPRSFAAWLRGLPVKPGRPPVHLFDGSLKSNQEAHHLVLDVDVGRRDRQQCADAVIRLRAEYLRVVGKEAEICFRFTNGSPARWTDWRDGMRPHNHGGKTEWSKTQTPDASYASFRRYLDIVFVYAGTHSLERELQRVADPRRIEAGDVFVEGGFPGHAVLVLDVAEDEAGRRAVLLGQSFMPAQEIHMLRGPGADPWYAITGDHPLTTPQWDFPAGALRRFATQGCPGRP